MSSKEKSKLLTFKANRLFRKKCQVAAEYWNIPQSAIFRQAMMDKIEPLFQRHPELRVKLEETDQPQPTFFEEKIAA